MKEVWKDIKGYEGLYQASNLGQIRSLPRKGTFKNIHILIFGKNHKGYLQVALTKNSISKTKSVHRLVAETFIPNPNNLPQVNHIDCNKENNNINNLEWCTNEYNTKHALANGLRNAIYKKGKENKNSITIKQYDLQGNFIKKWYCIKDVERELGFDNRNISACCRHKRNMAYGFIWRYIDDNSKIEYNPKTHNGRN